MTTDVKYYMGIDCATKRIDAVVIDREKNWKYSISIGTDEADIDRRLIDLYKQFSVELNKAIGKSAHTYFAAVENPIYIQNVKVTVSIAQTVACVKVALGEAGVPFFGIDNRAWKKSVLGDGNSDKNKIKAFAETLWDGKIKSQDLADASCIALWCHQRGA